MFQPIMPVLLDSDSADGIQFQGDVSAGKYAYIGLHIDATIVAMDLLVETEIGRIRMSEQGRDLVNVSWRNLVSINRYHGGNSRFDTTNGDAMCLIPRKWGNDNNAHLVTEQDLLKIQINHEAAYNTAVSGGTIEVYGLLSETGEHNYNLKILQFDEAVAASAVETIRVTEENVIALYVRNQATPGINRLRVSRDGQEVYNAALQAGAGFSDMLGQTDSLDAAGAAGAEGSAVAASSVFCCSFAGEGEIGEFLSDDIKIEITETTDAVTQEIVVYAADFSPSKLRQSKVETASILERKIARKNKLNRSRPVQALRTMGE